VISVGPGQMVVTGKACVGGVNRGWKGTLCEEEGDSMVIGNRNVVIVSNIMIAPNVILIRVGCQATG